MNILAIKMEFVDDSAMSGVYAYACAVGNSFKVKYISRKTPDGYEYLGDEMPDGAEVAVMGFMKFMEDNAKTGGFVARWMRIRDKMAYIPTSDDDVDDELISTSVVCVVRDGYRVNIQGFISMSPRWDYKSVLERE